jgi:hypothetical protein
MGLLFFEFFDIDIVCGPKIKTYNITYMTNYDVPFKTI